MFITSLAQYTKTVGINAIMGVEGGAKYTDIKADKGGKTRFGVTEDTANTWKSLWPKYNFKGDMSQLPGELAFEIYEKGFWNVCRLDEIVTIHPLLAHKLLDIAINYGPGGAGTRLQRLLNLYNRMGKDYPNMKVDGDIGPKTIECLRTFIAKRGIEGTRNLIISLFTLQNYGYIASCEKSEDQEEFANGWTSRVTHGLLDFLPFLK